MDKILFSLTVIAGSGGVTENRCVKHDGTVPTTVGEKALGIAEYDEIEARPAAVAVLGTKMAEAGAAFSAGDDLVTDATGRLITNPAVGGEFIVAEALQDATAAGSLAEVLFRRQST